MAILTPTAFWNKWGSITGLFLDNTTRQISESDMRDFVTDMRDSIPTWSTSNISDYADLTALSTAIPDGSSVKIATISKGVASAGNVAFWDSDDNIWREISVSGSIGLDDLTDVTKGASDVNSSATMRLIADPNNDGNYVIIDWTPPVGSGSASPITTKADITVGDDTGTPIRKQVGTNGHVFRGNSSRVDGLEYAALTSNPGLITTGGAIQLISNSAEWLNRRIAMNDVVTGISVDSTEFLRHMTLEFSSGVVRSVEFGAGHTFDGSNDYLTNFPIGANEIITCIGFYNGSVWRWTRSEIKAEERAFAAEITFNRNVTYDPVFVQGVGTLAITRALSGNFNNKLHSLKITTNGNPITLGSEFVQVVGDVNFMTANPGTYDVFFYNKKTQGIDEVLVSIPKAQSTTDTAGPLLVSAEVGNIDATSLILTYNENLDTLSVPAVGDYAPNDGAVNPATNVAVVGNTVDITLTNSITSLQTVTLGYTAGANPIRDSAQNNAANLVGQSVTNNVSADTTDPVWATVNFEIGNESDVILVMPANEALNPASSDVSHFTVRVAAVIRSISSLAFANSDTEVRLTLSSAVTNGQAVTVTYNGNGQLNSIRDVAGNEINNLLTETSVTNNVSAGLADATHSLEFGIAGYTENKWLQRTGNWGITHTGAWTFLITTRNLNNLNFSSNQYDFLYSGYLSSSVRFWIEGGIGVRTIKLTIVDTQVASWVMNFQDITPAQSHADLHDHMITIDPARAQGDRVHWFLDGVDRTSFVGQEAINHDNVAIHYEATTGYNESYIGKNRSAGRSLAGEIVRLGIWSEDKDVAFALARWDSGNLSPASAEASLQFYGSFNGPYTDTANGNALSVEDISGNGLHHAKQTYSAGEFVVGQKFKVL